MRFYLSLSLARSRSLSSFVSVSLFLSLSSAPARLLSLSRFHSLCLARSLHSLSLTLALLALSLTHSLMHTHTLSHTHLLSLSLCSRARADSLGLATHTKEDKRLNLPILKFQKTSLKTKQGSQTRLGFPKARTSCNTNRRRYSGKKNK